MQTLQAFNHGLVFLATSPNLGVTQEPAQGHLSRTKDAPSVLTTEEIAGVLEAVCHELAAGANMNCLLSHTNTCNAVGESQRQ